MSEDVLNNALIGMLMGLVCGIAPLILSLKKGKEGLAVAGLIFCALSGAILGVILALPVALILCAVALSLDKSEK